MKLQSLMWKNLALEKSAEFFREKETKDKIKNLIQEALKSVGITDAQFSIEHPTDLKMGDYSTNAGIKTGKAKEIYEHLAVQPPSWLEKVELAGPGFINFYLSKEFYRESLKEIMKEARVSERASTQKASR